MHFLQPAPGADPAGAHASPGCSPREEARRPLAGGPVRTWRRLLAAGLFAVLALPVLTGGARPAAAESATDAFDEGEAAREEMRWGDASRAYWRAIALDPAAYRAHVRFQETALLSGTSAESLASDYELLEHDFPAHAPVLALHRLRLQPAAARLETLATLLKAGESSDLHLELGRAQLATGDAEAALRSLVRACATASSRCASKPPAIRTASNRSRTAAAFGPVGT